MNAMQPSDPLPESKKPGASALHEQGDPGRALYEERSRYLEGLFMPPAPAWEELAEKTRERWQAHARNPDSADRPTGEPRVRNHALAPIHTARGRTTSAGKLGMN